jgi:hypothetical protein
MTQPYNQIYQLLELSTEYHEYLESKSNNLDDLYFHVGMIGALSAFNNLVEAQVNSGGDVAGLTASSITNHEASYSFESVGETKMLATYLANNTVSVDIESGQTYTGMRFTVTKVSGPASVYDTTVFFGFFEEAGINKISMFMAIDDDYSSYQLCDPANFKEFNFEAPEPEPAEPEPELPPEPNAPVVEPGDGLFTYHAPHYGSGANINGWGSFNPDGSITGGGNFPFRGIWRKLGNDLIIWHPFLWPSSGESTRLCACNKSAVTPINFKNDPLIGQFKQGAKGCTQTLKNYFDPAIIQGQSYGTAMSHTKDFELNSHINGRFQGCGAWLANHRMMASLRLRELNPGGVPYLYRVLDLM